MRKPRLALVLTAAGRSERFGSGKKELASLGPKTVLDAALYPFLELPDLSLVVVTAPSDGLEPVRSAFSAESLARLEGRGAGFLVVRGGATRKDSVRAGLEAAAASLGEEEPLGPEDIVLVHDGARPWPSAALVRAVADKAREEGAALPLCPLTDTPKLIAPEDAGGEGGLVLGHPKRASLAGAQTPQGFRLLPLLEAHRRAEAEGLDCTDDTELWARYASPAGEGPVAWVRGEVANRKITFASDLSSGAHMDSDKAKSMLRIGEGWDIHRLSPGRKLWLGGLEIEAEAGEVAHSDGDVLLHAVIDALLGAAALGDIGAHFPPSDPKWKDADSKALTRSVIDLVRAAGCEPVNLDCTVVTESPRLGPHRDAIRVSLASLLGMDLAEVSVKAKTKEGVDAVGEGRAIEARAVVLLEKGRTTP